MATYVALLHSISLGAGGRLKMADLRAIAKEVGFFDPRTRVATGNLIFESEEAPLAEIESQLEAAFSRKFGRSVDIIARTADGFLRLAAGNPFAGGKGSEVSVRVMRRPLGHETIAKLAAFSAPEIRMALCDGDLWIDFSGNPGETRLLSHLTTKKLGVGTLRNANTIAGLARMLA